MESRAGTSSGFVDTRDNGNAIDGRFNQSQTSDEELLSNLLAEEGTSALPAKSKPNGKLQLPAARVKSIMKTDPDVHTVSQDAVVLLTKATELFLDSLASETFQVMQRSKRKTVQQRDIDIVIQNNDTLCFLEGALD